MGQREKYLNCIIDKIDKSKPCFEKPDYSKPEFKEPNDEIIKIYKKLGGKNIYPTSFRRFDIKRQNFFIELDEERHFNRYRLLTLNSSIYKNYKYFNLSNYKNYCKVYETPCLSAASWGRNWKNDSTEKQFGTSDKEGCLRKLGSSRWKQRAFYDFLKDVTGLIIGIPIIRVSIWDKLNESDTIDVCLRCQKEKILLEYLKPIIKEANKSSISKQWTSKKNKDKFKDYYNNIPPQ